MQVRLNNMELLIIGIDGGDERIIRGMDMPYLNGLLDKSYQKRLSEDLYSRGWAEILTGESGAVNGGVYNAPKLDGSYDFTFKFGMNDMLGDEGLTPLPRMVNQFGRKIGMMNVPTSSPAMEADGFIVGGGGGGMKCGSGIPDGLIWPKCIKEYLENCNYTADIRLTGSGIETFSQLVDSLDEAIDKRVATFNHLSEEYKVDVGFLCLRVTTDIQYLAMGEIECILASREMPDSAGTFEPNSIQVRILDHYRRLDKVIEDAFRKNNPKHYIITSDHGASRYLYQINFDAVLQELGYQFSNDQNSVRALVRKVARRFLSKKSRSKIRKVGGKGGMKFAHRFNVKKSLAFGAFYARGVFINDARRFGGPVLEGEELDKLVDDICREINAHHKSKEIGLEVQPYRRHFMGNTYSDRLADIIVRTPDTLFAENRGPYISRNHKYGPIDENLIGISSDMHSGQKGKNPLFFASEQIGALADSIPINDLRLVYRVVEKYLRSNES